MEESDLIKKAKEFALKVHEGQMYGDKPYITHLEKVVQKVIKWKAHCPTALEIMIICAYLHDCIEDGHPGGKEMYKLIVSAFGKEVADIVFDVTNELGRNRQEQNHKTYPKIANSLSAKYLKLCDREANVENSLEEGSSMWKTYKKEQLNFELVIRANNITELEAMWTYLNCLLDHESSFR